MFIPADVFSQKKEKSLGFHSFFHKSTLSNLTQCQKGEVWRFGGEVRFTRFGLACWDQRSWSSMHKLTDGTLLRELETSQSSWVSNRTREAISNARHSRPRPPSHIRNLKTQRRQQLSWLLVECFCWGRFMCWSNVIVCGSVGLDVWCYFWGLKTTRNSCHFCQLFLQAPKLHPNQTGHYKKKLHLYIKGKYSCVWSWAGCSFKGILHQLSIVLYSYGIQKRE